MEASKNMDIRSGSKRDVFFKTLMGLSGGAAIVLSFWAAIISGFLIGNSIFILLYADGYKLSLQKTKGRTIKRALDY